MHACLPIGFQSGFSQHDISSGAGDMELKYSGWIAQLNYNHCQTSDINHTKSQYWNVSRLILQLSLPNPLKPGVKSRMKM